MPVAFVLINTETGSESEVLEAIRKVAAVEEAHMVYGVYDVIAKVKAETMGHLKEIITWQVRRLNKVRSTTTITGTEETK